MQQTTSAHAQIIKKPLRSTSSQFRRGGEKLYVIESYNYSGTFIYTKGKIDQEKGQPFFFAFSSPQNGPLSPVKHPPLKRCPLCGSRDIHRVCISLTRRGNLIHDVPVDQCDNCGEQYLDPFAISLLKPALRRRRAG